MKFRFFGKTRLRRARQRRGALTGRRELRHKIAEYERRLSDDYNKATTQRERTEIALLEMELTVMRMTHNV